MSKSSQDSGIHVGDHVEWDSRQGHSSGVVEKELTHATKIKSFVAKATEEAPQYLVKSDTTGAEAAHKPEALTKSKGGKDESKDKESDAKEDKKGPGKHQLEESEKKGGSPQKKAKGKASAKGGKKKKDDSADAEEEKEEKAGKKGSSKKGGAKGKKKETKEVEEGEEEEEEEGESETKEAEEKEEGSNKTGAKKKTGPKKKAAKKEDKEETKEEQDETNKEKKHEKEAEEEDGEEESAQDSGDKDQIIKDFRSLVNMTGGEIHKWLGTEDSKSVGWKGEGGHDASKESVGHASGKRIIELLKKKDDDFTDDDLQHMRKVRSYIKRHSAQKPHKDVEHSHWRYSLMNWGHDPSKA